MPVATVTPSNLDVTDYCYAMCTVIPCGQMGQGRHSINKPLPRNQTRKQKTEDNATPAPEV